MDYRRQAVELREAGVAKEEWERDRRRLEEQVRKKDEELRIQEEEQAKLKRMYVRMFSVLILCVCPPKLCVI